MAKRQGTLTWQMLFLVITTVKEALKFRSATWTDVTLNFFNELDQV